MENEVISHLNVIMLIKKCLAFFQSFFFVALPLAAVRSSGMFMFMGVPVPRRISTTAS